MKKIVLFFVAITTISCSNDSDQEDYTAYAKVSTIATALFDTPQFPTALTIDGNGNMYVASFQSTMIKKIDKNGVVTKFAGSGKYEDKDGTGEAASFTTIITLAADSKGNIYVEGNNDGALRRITPEGIVSTFLKKSEMPYSTMGLFIDKQDNLFFSTGNAILKRTSAGILTVFAGNPDESTTPRDGTGINARFSAASFMAMDSKGNLYVKENVIAEGIRKITPEGVVTTIRVIVKKDGADETYTNLQNAQGIAIDKKDNIYVSTQEHNILQITPEGRGYFLLGTTGSGYKDGSLEKALITSPGRIVFDKNDDLILIENHNNGINIRKISKK